MKLKKLIIYSLFFLIGCSQLSFGQFNKAGRTSLQFLKIGNGARQSALGEACIAGVKDINMVFWNPAALSGLPGVEAAFNYTKWFGDLNVMSAAAGFYLDGVGTIAINYITLDYGDLQEALTTSPTGNIDSRTGNTFTGNDLAFGVAFSRRFTDKLSIGFNIKYLQEKLFIYTSSAWGFDVGSFYDTGWRGIKIGMSAQNFSSQMRWLNTREEEQQSFELPLVYRIGVSIDLLGGEDLFLGGNPEQHRLAMNVDAIHTNDYAERLNLGMEYWAFNMFAIRGGYRLNYEEGSLSAGIGVNYDTGPVQLQIDYSYVQYDFLDSPHRFTVMMAF